MKITKCIFIISNLMFAPYLLGFVYADEKIANTTENRLSQSSIVNNFSFKLLRAITVNSAKQNNIVVSPLSAAFTLGILNDGADGRTRAEIDSVLGCNNAYFDSLANKMLIDFNQMDTLRSSNFTDNLLPEQENNPFHPSVGKSTYKDSLSYKLSQSSERIGTLAQVLMSNCIIVNNKYRLKKEYQNKVSKTYSAFVQPMNFSSPPTKDFINNWCSKRTCGMIPEIIDQLDSNTCMYALNTLYFHGKWADDFDEEDTKYDSFKKSNHHSEKIKMMNKKANCLYNKNKLYTSLNMEYGDGKYSMIVLLPNKDNSTNDMLKKIDGNSWQENLKEMKPKAVKVKIPKFTIKTNLNLVKPLKEMGIVSAFVDDRADFNHISNDLLSVSLFIQKVRIDVNEKDTRAEAATLAGRIAGYGGPVKEPKYTEFYATHPFVYAIIENATNTILFIGKYEGEEE
jgi:serine protease inhibitor